MDLGFKEKKKKNNFLSTGNYIENWKDIFHCQNLDLDILRICDCRMLLITQKVVMELADTSILKINRKRKGRQEQANLQLVKTILLKIW